MPAKTTHDLPKNVLIQVRTYPNNNDLLIEAVDSTGEPNWVEEEERNLFALTAERLKNPQNGLEVWRVLNTLACQGWGPFVYDLAMELASSDGRGGLLTGTGQSDDAKGLWKFYRDNRADVSKTPLPSDHPWLKGTIDKDFPFIWTKQLSILPKVEAAGLLKYEHGHIKIESDNTVDNEIDEQIKKQFEDENQAT